MQEACGLFCVCRRRCGVASSLDPEGLCGSGLRSVVSEDPSVNRKSRREVI